MKISQKHVQIILTIIWFLMFFPALMFWQKSVPYLVFVSVYANFVGHLSAAEAAGAKESGLTREEAEEVLEWIRNQKDSGQE